MDTPATNDRPTPGGRVEIADNAITSTVRDAVMSCYGVVDLVPRSIGAAISRRLRLPDNALGIDVETRDGHTQVEISIVVEYGTPIFTVAQNVMHAVKFQLERTLGLTVDHVNVNVDGLRVSGPDGS